jgi:cytochrome P450
MPWSATSSSAKATGSRCCSVRPIANPARWDRPDQYDLARKKLPHLGFAFGLHSCLGMNLARLEAQIFLEELLAVLPDWTVHRPLDFGTNFTVRGPSRVLVSVH